MNIIDDIRRPILSEVGEYEQFLARHMTSSNEAVEGILGYIVENGGKGFRPLAVLLSAALNSPSPEKGLGPRSYLAAMLVEMMHAASLVHDDVIDESDLRRGKPSVRALWGSRRAVIAGDMLLAKSISVGLDSAQYDIVDYVTRAMWELCEGELIQSRISESLDMTREVYLDIIHKKTGILFGVSAGAGALSVGASREKIAAMRSFGEWVGMAFQIRDDILDYDILGDTGKPACNDLQEHKITLPLLVVLERSTPERKAELLAMLAATDTEPGNIALLRDAVVSGGGIDEAEKVMQAHIARAQSLLAAWPPSPFHTSLMMLASYAASRQK
ncbi:MAG: polyprenyl synthetase family protein [Alistipes sp.]|jgi:octaprenyl-diphosphate synthase|nr:polyprenyl synthetase family protein [Alistipes sp.]